MQLHQQLARPQGRPTTVRYNLVCTCPQLCRGYCLKVLPCNRSPSQRMQAHSSRLSDVHTAGATALAAGMPQPHSAPVPTLSQQAVPLCEMRKGGHGV
jgi:hypothetical protein